MAKAGFGTYREQGLIKNNAWLGEGSKHRWSSLEKLQCCQLRLPPIHTTSQQQLQQKKNGYDLHYVETTCTDGIRSNTARIWTGKIMCYSFVFGTLTIEDHIVVLEILPLLIPFWVFMQHHTHGLPRKCRKHGYLWTSNLQLLVRVRIKRRTSWQVSLQHAVSLRLIHHINDTQLSGARQAEKANKLRLSPAKRNSIARR